jgi:hypothetical protein
VLEFLLDGLDNSVLAHKLNQMKTAFYSTLMAIALSAQGEVSTNFLFRDPAPIINNTIRCDLSPLFIWWNAELQAQENLRAQNTNGANSVSTNTIPRPMQPWLHLVGTVTKDDSEGWIVNVTVEKTPGSGIPMEAMLINPPRAERGRFLQRLALINDPLPMHDYSSREEDIATINYRAFVANTLGDQDLEDAYVAQAAEAKQQLEAQKQQDQMTVEERTQSIESLGYFPPDWLTYRVDVFAFNTGRQIGRFPIFDAGLSFAK